MRQAFSPRNLTDLQQDLSDIRQLADVAAKVPVRMVFPSEDLIGSVFRDILARAA